MYSHAIHIFQYDTLGHDYFIYTIRLHTGMFVTPLCHVSPVQFMPFLGFLCVVTKVCFPNSIYLSGDDEGAE